MKKSFLFVGILTVFCLLCFSGCSFLPSANGDIIYNLLESDTYEVIGFSGEETSITIPDTYNGKAVSSIGNNAFFEETTLAEVIMPSTLTSIGNSAFEKCSAIEGLIIPEGVTQIGEYAFRECTKLKKLTIPDSVVFIGQGAFNTCGSLNYDKYNEDLTLKYLSKWLIGANNNSISVVNIYEETVGIYDYAFDNCTSISRVVIPSGVKYIGTKAFENCTGMNVLSITATSEEGIISLGTDTFLGCTSLAHIYVPDETTANAYKADSSWTSFSDIISVNPI
ncbi:MAG: leucine-rich repeat protein [Clostridia bacterium]|jgi:hypothetical protein|nr:leucine-rich repeat protein [Clostridia bacterium]